MTDTSKAFTYGHWCCGDRHKCLVFIKQQIPSIANIDLGKGEIGLQYIYESDKWEMIVERLDIDEFEIVIAHI